MRGHRRHEAAGCRPDCGVAHWAMTLDRASASGGRLWVAFDAGSSARLCATVAATAAIKNIFATSAACKTAVSSVEVCMGTNTGKRKINKEDIKVRQ